MELTLNKKEYTYFEPVTAAPFSAETLREHIVPDSCADIARIVQTTAQVWVTTREIDSDGRIVAGGTFDVSVLYIPEKGGAPCALRLQLPFESRSDSRVDAESMFPDVCAKVRNIEARLLNPRKILIRANVDLYPSFCRRVSLSVCNGVQDGENIEMKCEEHETKVIAAVREKEFSVTEELQISPQRGEVDEIICCRPDVRSTDCKLIGNKLVVKGIILASVLYRERGGRLEVTRHELPFSQIVDGAALEEEWENECSLSLVKCDCAIGCEGDALDTHTMTLSLQLRARVTVWRTEKIEFIADLYDTASLVDIVAGEITLREECQRHARRQNVRHLLETGNAVKTILDAEVQCGVFAAGGGVESVEIPVWVRCLYLDEADEIHGIHHEFSVAVPTEQGAGIKTEGMCVSLGDAVTGILPDGIELRVPLECMLATCRVTRHLSVNGAETREEEDKCSRCPSVVLRKIGRGESLWSVAKQYRTTCGAILAANNMEEEREIPLDKLLLIPRCR